jgi:hypothetical protein
MNDTESENKNLTEMQRQAAEWLLRGEPNVVVTLTFDTEEGVSYKFAEEVFGTFAHKLKCHLFSKKSKKRIPMCPSVEHYGREMMWKTSAPGVRQGTHIHCLMRLPGNPMDYMEVVRKLWVSSNSLCGNPKVNCPNNDDWFKELATEESRRRMTNYALKTCGNNFDAVLVKFMPIRLAT